MISLPTTLFELRERVSSIPDDQWTTDRYEHDGKYCFFGHMGCDREAHTNNIAIENHIYKLIGNMDHLFSAINDGRDPSYQQATPKARVLAFIDDVIAEGL